MVFATWLLALVTSARIDYRKRNSLFLEVIERIAMKYLVREPQAEYITKNGRKTGVKLRLRDYKMLLRAYEELRDIQSAEARRNEPTIDYHIYRQRRFSRMKSAQ